MIFLLGIQKEFWASLSIKVIVLHRYFELSVQMNVSPIANTCFLTIGMVFDGVCDVYNAPGGRNQKDFLFHKKNHS